MRNSSYPVKDCFVAKESSPHKDTIKFFYVRGNVRTVSTFIFPGSFPEPDLFDNGDGLVPGPNHQSSFGRI